LGKNALRFFLLGLGPVFLILYFLLMVLAEGLEPPRLSALASKASVSANFTTRARRSQVLITFKGIALDHFAKFHLYSENPFFLFL
jgi:hypothetical protein